MTHMHRTALYQDCYLLGCNAAHSLNIYRRFDRRPVSMCMVTRSHVPEDCSLRSQLRIHFVFVKKSVQII